MSDRALLEALTASQRLGMLGSRPVAEVVDHASCFVGALADVTGTVIDLGSGGGVPGLVVARARPDLRLILVDRRTARTDHLRRLVGRLGLEDRVSVVAADASALPSLLDPADAVVAKGFGPPAVTLTAASPMLLDDGCVVISEPPGGRPGRWDRRLLATLGLRVVDQDDVRVAVFRHVSRGT